jgi:hypothetical protein
MTARFSEGITDIAYGASTVTQASREMTVFGSTAEFTDAVQDLQFPVPNGEKSPTENHEAPNEIGQAIWVGLKSVSQTVT